jgi:uncharacterized protein with WD repeat
VAFLRFVSLLILPSQAPNKKEEKNRSDLENSGMKTGQELLAVSQTEADSTGKSYYGETNVYYMSTSGKFDCKFAPGTVVFFFADLSSSKLPIFNPCKAC